MKYIINFETNVMCCQKICDPAVSPIRGSIWFTYMYLLALFLYLKDEKEWMNLLSTHARRTTFQTKTNVQQSVASFGFFKVFYEEVVCI